RTGALQGFIPFGGFIIPSNASAWPDPRSYETYRGLGQLVGSIAGMFFGTGMAMGGVAMGGLGLLGAGPTFGSSLVVSATGLGAIVAGALEAQAAAINFLHGVHTLVHAMSMSSTSGSAPTPSS